MAYTPANGLNINGNFVPDGVYTPTTGLLLNGNFISRSSYRALLICGSAFRQITDVEIGAGLKPLTLLNGIIKEREISEGLPIIYDGLKIRTLSHEEALLI